MANAFDRVNHPFLLKVLRAFGFLPHFFHLIKACIGNPWIAPLVNGRPSIFFQAQRGIRQGCPLSPFSGFDSSSSSIRWFLCADSQPGVSWRFHPAHSPRWSHTEISHNLLMPASIIHTLISFISSLCSSGSPPIIRSFHRLVLLPLPSIL